MTSLLVSLCIPTKDRPDNIRATLQSIVDENVDTSLVQIVISDNSSDRKTELVAADFSALNIKYYKSPILGFLNSIEALKQGDGELLKLQNDYSAFSKGGLRELISVAEREILNKPQILFTGGAIKINDGQHRSNSFDAFLAASEYFNTWSTAYSIWKQDIERIFTSGVPKLNDQFPHTSLLMLTNNKDKYLVYDKPIYENQTVQRKGGYNIFYIFCIVYPSMLKQCLDENKITSLTYNKIIQKMKYYFISRWIALTIFDKNSAKNYTFDSSNWRNNVISLYGRVGLYQITMMARLFSLVRRFRRVTVAK